MKTAKDRPKELSFPAEVWFYVTLPRESDKETMLTKEAYDELRDYEPMMYRSPYEVYVKKFNSYKQEKYDFTLRTVGVTRDTVDKVYNDTITLPDFVGWLVSGENE